MSHAGKLIVIEGPDNVGRSLHTRLLSARLKAHGIATHIIGLARSELMGEIVKSRTADMHQLNWRTRSLLYATDLHDQIKHEAEPLLTPDSWSSRIGTHSLRGSGSRLGAGTGIGSTRSTPIPPIPMP